MLTLTRKQFVRLTHTDDRFSRRFQNSSSPGPVAQRLGISRQRVYKMLHDGVLDGARVVNADGATAFVVVFDDSVAARERGRAAATA